MGAGGYGIRVYRNGVELHGDGRLRFRRKVSLTEWGPEYVTRRRGFRGRIGEWTKASAARLRFVTANADALFATHLTLTYRAATETWESDAERNQRIIRRTFADRHRFLRGLRAEIGEYLWVREFQARGVVRYHVLCERAVSQERASAAWCRASGQLHDPDVMRHGVRADEVRSQGGALSYLSRYLGKERQKELPAGVAGGGRWWGRSRTLKLATLAEVIWFDGKERMKRFAELRITRILRAYVSKRFGRRYRGGAFVDYGGVLCAKLTAMVEILRAHYGTTPSGPALLRSGWVEVGT